jgi:hypothetical protein
VLRSESQVVENNAVNKTNIWPNTSSSGTRSQQSSRSWAWTARSENKRR